MGLDPLPSHMQFAVVPSPHSSLSSFRFANFVTVTVTQSDRNYHGKFAFLTYCSRMIFD